MLQVRGSVISQDDGAHHFIPFYMYFSLSNGLTFLDLAGSVNF